MSNNKEKEIIEKRKREEWEKRLFKDFMFSENHSEKSIKLSDWIKENTYPKRTLNEDASSYRVKHLAEEDLGFYITNDQLKYRMDEVGIPHNWEEPNWYFFCYFKADWESYVNKLETMLEKSEKN